MNGTRDASDAGSEAASDTGDVLGIDAREDATATDAADVAPDAQVIDTGEADVNAIDAAEPDVQAIDAGEADVQPIDASVPDAGPIDAGDRDATIADGDVPTDATGDGGTDSALAADSATPDASACVYSITPSTMNFSTRTPTSAATSMCVSKTVTLTVTVTAGCVWSAIADGGTSFGWIAITSGGGPSTGTGAGQTVTYSVASNAHSATPRSGTITVLAADLTPTTAVHTTTQVADPLHACP